MTNDVKNTISRRFVSTTFAIACFSHRESGLGVDIWLNGDYDDKRKHNDLPRVKLVLPNRSVGIIVSISCDCKVLYKPPKISNNILAKLEKVMPFISQNADILVKHWSKELDDLEALIGLRIRCKYPLMPFDEVMRKVNKKLSYKRGINMNYGDEETKLINNEFESEEEAAFEWATVRSIDSGLKSHIWLDDGAKKRGIKHSSMRIRYGADQDIEIVFNEVKGDYRVIGGYEKSDFDIDRVMEWIILNHEALLRCYTGKDDKGNPYNLESFESEMKSLSSAKRK